MKNSFSCLGMFNQTAICPGVRRSLLALALTVGLLGAGSAAAAVAPTISTQPSASTVYVGTKGAFSVVALGDAPMFYQWRSNGVSIALATNATYTTPVTTLSNNGTAYSVVVTNASGSIFSSSAILNVSAAAPSIVTQPANVTNNYAGNTAAFSIVATGSVPMAYQWYTNGAIVASATNASYTTPVTTSGYNGLGYSVVITNSSGSVTSSVATLTVLSATVPNIYTQPTNSTGYNGYTVTFVVAASGTPTMVYQWFTNGVKITGATSASYKTPALSAGYNGLAYSVIVSNGYGPVTSASATLTVVAPSAPAITVQPVNAVGVSGQKVAFSVGATGAPLFYQWRTNNGALSGATSSFYSNTCSLAQNGYQFSVIVSNSMGSITSAPATLYVLGALQIAFRSLTPGEITEYNLPTNTQTAAGGPNVAIGQPAYLEALITRNATNAIPTTNYIKNVTWTLAHKANGSISPNVLRDSPLTSAVPCADYGDTLAYEIAGRKMLVPDAVGTNNNGDYVVVVSITWTNDTIFTATNTVYGSRYMGKAACYTCHGSMSNGFEQTSMASTFIGAVTFADGTNFTMKCAACHALGYDPTTSATNGGFDDVARGANWTFPKYKSLAAAANNWNSMPAAVKAKASVQCESCHGPGQRHILAVATGNLAQSTNMITMTLSANNCGQCHDSPADGYWKKNEWDQAWHGTGDNGGSEKVFKSGSCGKCHGTLAFLNTNLPGDTNVVIVGGVLTNDLPWVGTYNEGVTCAACHETHNTGMGNHQLRNIPSWTLNNGFVTTNAGNGQICIACHHERDNNVTTAVALTNATVNSPHNSPQADLLFGQNAFTFGLTLPSPAPHTYVPETCVGCHMQDEQAGINVTNMLAYPSKAHHVGGHTFTVDYLNPAGGAIPIAPGVAPYLTERCVSCHGGVTNVTFGGEVFTTNLVSCQSEVSNLLYTLAKALDPTNSGFAINKSLISTAQTPAGLAQRGAYYNYFFVRNDQSLGVHNPPFAKSLLRASIAAIGGVGPYPYGAGAVPAGRASPALAANGSSGSGSSGSGSDSGSGSSGSSGVSPMALGAAGTSGSTKWGSVPIQLNVSPAATAAPTADNTIVLNPALELGYHPDPDVVGKTIKFQAIENLGPNGEWVDLSPAVVASNAWHYQLISYRDATQRFFRVTEP